MSNLSPLFMVGKNTVEEQRARWERKRIRTAKELLETEYKYLEQLDLVLTFFVKILKAKGTLKPAVLETIFGPLESIYLASHVLSLQLERGHLGPGLENFCPNLELYGHYAENLEQANKALQVLVYVCGYPEHIFLREFSIYSHSALAGKPGVFAVGTPGDNVLFMVHYLIEMRISIHCIKQAVISPERFCVQWYHV